MPASDEPARGAEFPADSPTCSSVGGTSLTRKRRHLDEHRLGRRRQRLQRSLLSAALWQSAVAGFAATGCGGGRAIADVSAIGDPNTGVDVYDSTPEEPGGPTGWGVWGGTSVASPIVAAEFALAGGRQRRLLPCRDALRARRRSRGLYDVTSRLTTANAKAATICKAASGFDGPTAVGSPLGLGAFAVAGAPEEHLAADRSPATPRKGTP